MLTTALDRAADAYLESDRGQQAIAERVYGISQEENEG